MVVEHIYDWLCCIEFSHLITFENLVNGELKLILVHVVMTTVVEISKHDN